MSLTLAPCMPALAKILQDHTDEVRHAMLSLEGVRRTKTAKLETPSGQIRLRKPRDGRTVHPSLRLADGFPSVTLEGAGVFTMIETIPRTMVSGLAGRRLDEVVALDHLIMAEIGSLRIRHATPGRSTATGFGPGIVAMFLTIGLDVDLIAVDPETDRSGN